MEVVGMSGLVDCGARLKGVAHFSVCMAGMPVPRLCVFAGHRFLRLGRLR